MAAEVPLQYLGTTADGTWRVTGTASQGAANTTTQVTYAALAVGIRPVNPTASNGTVGTIPAAGGAPRGVGWRMTTALSATEPTFFVAGQTWPATMTIASSSSLTLAITCIAYLGTTEVARGTSTAVATTTTRVATWNLTSTAHAVAAAGARLSFEYYVEASGINGNALGTTTVTMTVGATASSVDPGVFSISYPRTATEVRPVPVDSATRRITGFRSVGDTIAVVDSARRAVTVGRRTADSLLVVDSAHSQETYPRIAFDAAVAAMDMALRTQTSVRRVVELEDTVLGLAARDVMSRRTATESVVTVDAAAVKLVTYGRAVRHQFTPGDEPLVDPRKRIQGIVRNEDSTPYLGEAKVYLVRDDDVVVADTTSSPIDGSYVFMRNSFDTSTYYVVAFTDGPMPREAVTERALVPL